MKAADFNIFSSRHWRLSIFLTILLACSFANGHLSEETGTFGAENGQIQADTIAVCRSYIPFAVDVSTKLTAAQFKALKSFLFRPFLSSLFPVDIQPAPFSTYSEQNHGYRRPSNVSEVVNFVNNAVQGTSTYSFVTRPLKFFVDQNITNLATTKLAVNTVIFAGNSISASDIPVVQNYISILTAYDNTVTVVLMDPNIDQTNYEQIPGLKLIVWSDPTTTINAVRSGMKCQNIQSTTTTIRPTTTFTPTVSPIVCPSYIPFSFDVATDLTATQFVELKTFLLSSFLSELFPLNVQPAVFSTYDTTNHNYTRPNNVLDIVNNVQNSIQSTATTSDFIQPLQYFYEQGVADLGSTNGLAVNTIIFAGSPLTDVDTAGFLAPQLTTNGNTLTVVLVNPNIDQTNYRQVTGLNIVVWNNTAALIDAIRAVMNCQPLPSTSVPSPSPITGTTPTPVVNPCYSYIPFSFDNSLLVSSSKFAALKSFLIQQFLGVVFVPNVPPAYFSTFADTVYDFRLQDTVNAVINVVNRTGQKQVAQSNVKSPVSDFVSKNVVKLGADDFLPVNTVIFTGSALNDGDVTEFTNYALNLTTNGNTLTVVLLESTIDVTNYQKVQPLNLVTWTDPLTTISNIRQKMQCRLN